MEPAADQTFVTGLYNSALLTGVFPVVTPPVTSTLPLVSNVAVWYSRAVAMFPALDQAFVTGLYKSVLFVMPLTPTPPVTSTRPFGSRVEVCKYVALVIVAAD